MQSAAAYFHCLNNFPSLLILSHWRILFNQVLTKSVDVARVSIFPYRIQVDIPIIHIASGILYMATSAATAALNFGRFKDSGVGGGNCFTVRDVQSQVGNVADDIGGSSQRIVIEQQQV